MKALVVATSAKLPNIEHEIGLGQRPRLNYLELCRRLGASYMDYDPPSLHHHRVIRRLEERLQLDVYWALRIANQVKAQRCDVVLSMSERVGIPLGYVLGPAVRHVVIVHHPMSPKKLRMMKALRAVQRWDLTLTLSQAEADALQAQFHVGPDRIKVRHESVDTAFYKLPSERSSATDVQNHILSLGLSKRDYPTLIAAMRRLPHVTCEISATSAWVSHQAGYENESVPDNVQLKPYDHPLVIRDAYARSRFVVLPLMPHLTQWSAGAATLLQAQSLGKAVIATRTPGTSDYVLDGETGLLVEPGNPEAMAEAIDCLWRNPEKAEAMGRRARERMECAFSMDGWLDEVSGLLGSGASLTR